MTDRLNPSSAVTVEEMNDFIATELPFAKSMGLSCESMAQDVGVVRFRFDERWTRPGDVVSGPVLMALADLAVYVAIFTRIGIVPMAVTSELKTNFLRPAVGHDLLATATVLKFGRRQAYGVVSIVEDHAVDRLIAHASATYALPDEGGSVSSTVGEQ